MEKNNTNSDKIRVLYIDDEVNNLAAFKANFRRVFEVYTAESASEGKKILKEHTDLKDGKDIEVIISDQRMPEMTGVEFFESILKEYPTPIRILLTGYADIEAVISAINKGQVYRYITKPWNENELKSTIENAFEVYSLRQENKELTKSLVRANKQLEFMLRQKLIS